MAILLNNKVRYHHHHHHQRLMLLLLSNNYLSAQVHLSFTNFPIFVQKWKTEMPRELDWRLETVTGWTLESRGEGSLALTFGTILILTSHYSLPGGGGGSKN